MKLNNLLRSIRKQDGFTMVEMVIVIVLIGIIAMTASLLIGQAAQTYQKEDNYSAITNQGRLALETMAREIRMIRSTSDITSSCASTTALNFTDTNGTLVAYSFSGSTLLAGTNPLATNLTSFGITYYDESSPPVTTTTCSAVWNVTVSLTVAQGGDSLTMRTTIHPRSF
jgi:prepilin-type N-terminal cleavage/methylation domain-containing protein